MALTDTDKKTAPCRGRWDFISITPYQLIVTV